MLDTVIVGAGIAGLTAAIYAARSRMPSVLIEKAFAGGQILNTEQIDNYPGLPQISGFELGTKLRKHAESCGAVLTEAEAICIEQKSDRSFLIELSAGAGEIEARTVIYAAGAHHRMLNIPGERELYGHGVSYCASCDAAFFSNRVTAVIGGGDTALSDALILSRMCKTVYLVHRRDRFRAAAELRERVGRTENIIPVLNSLPVSIEGIHHVRALKIQNVQNTALQTLEADGIFIAVGMQPNTGLLSGLVRLDQTGYVMAKEDGSTSLPGLFAAGDVRTKTFRQLITAAADGAVCIHSAEQYLNML